MNAMSFYEFRSEQSDSGSTLHLSSKLHFQGNKTISPTNLFQQYIQNLSE